MAEERKICGNCGTPLIIQDGKIICPNCGTEYAVDWDRDDVARAEAETEQERNQAQLEREQIISQTREGISRQQSYNSRRRESQRAHQGIENRIIRIGVIVASFFVLLNLFRACTFIVGRNYGSITEAVFGEAATTETTRAANEITNQKIDEKVLLGDEDFLKTAYASQVYVVKYLTDREIIPDGTDTKLIFTGNFEYEEGFLIYSENSRTELLSIFAAEYAPENGGENVTVYIPVLLGMDGIREDGDISCHFESRWYKGTRGQQGFRDKELILDAMRETWETMSETVPFDIPESIRSQVTEI